MLLRSLYGATAVMAVSRRCCGGNGGAAAILTLAQPAVALRKFCTYMFKVSAVPPRRSAMLTVFRGATAINDRTTAEPLRPWRCNYGLCRASTAVAPRLRCDGGRRSAVMTILRDATAINDGTNAIMAVSLRPRRQWRCHCGLCRTSTAVVPRLRCDGGIMQEATLLLVITII